MAAHRQTHRSRRRCAPRFRPLLVEQNEPRWLLAPAALPDSYTVAEEALLERLAPGVLANDTGGASIAILESNVAHGTLNLSPDGTFTYTPVKDYYGLDHFTYRAGDGQSQSAPATVTINVTPVLDIPVAVDDVITVLEDQDAKNVHLWANDSVDPHGADFRLVINRQPQYGYISGYHWKGYITYDPPQEYSGPDSFTYSITDGKSIFSNVATVSITVQAVNDLPVAQQDSFTSSPGTTLTVAAPGVLGNDSDVDGVLSAVLITGVPAAAGVVVVNSDGGFEFVPAAGFSGTTTFVYGATDGLATTSRSVQIRVAENRPPSAKNDRYELQEDTSYVTEPYYWYGLLNNDSDPDGGTLITTLISGPSHGTLKLRGNGLFEYVPVPNFNGIDNVVYRASDGTFGALATVSLVVKPINDAPVATGESFTTAEDVPLVIGDPGLLANDTDIDGAALTAWPVTRPAHGTLSLNPNGRFTYTPNANFAGSDHFTYQAVDRASVSNIVTVAITVSPVSDAPLGVGDHHTIRKDDPLSIAAPGVLANDTDGDGQPITAALQTGPANGTLTLEPNGAFLYTPNAGFTGADRFTYRASDAALFSADTTVIINVVDGSTATANNDSYTTPEDTPLTIPAGGVLTNDVGLSLTLALVTGPEHGTVQLNATGSFVYTPHKDYHGPDRFTYRIGEGQSTNNVATVALTISPVNDPPVPVNDYFYSPGYFRDPIYAPFRGVLIGDRDAEHDLLTVGLVSAPLYGSLVLHPDGSFIYRPENVSPGYQDRFLYRLSDGKNTSETFGTVTLSGYCWQWECEDSVLDETYLAVQGTLLSVPAPGVLRNDSPWHPAVLFDGPTHGKLTFNVDGSFNYQPDPGFTGEDYFTYVASGGSSTGIGTTRLIVNPANPSPTSGPNHAPRGFDGAITTYEGASYAFAPADFVMTDPSDVPANVLAAVQITSLPYEGFLKSRGASVTPGQFISVTDIFNGHLTYQPPLNAGSLVTSTQFTFRVMDDGGTASGGVNLDPQFVTMTVSIHPVNDPPEGRDGLVTTSTTLPYPFQTADFPFGDSLDVPNNRLKAIKVVALPGAGRLTSGGADVLPGQFISIETIDLGQFLFIPAAAQVGFPSTSFTFQVQDDGGTLAGGIDLDASPSTMSINVAPGEYLPSGADKSIEVVKGQSYSFSIADFGFSSPTGVPPQDLGAVKITTLPDPYLGSLSTAYGNGPYYVYSVQAGQSISAADIAAGSLRFYPSVARSPLTSLTFQVQSAYGTDPSPNTLTFNSIFVNHAPKGAFGSAVTLATLPYTFKPIDFSYNFSDIGDYPQNKLLAIKITTLPPTGTLINGGASVVQGQLIPLADIAASNFVFTPNSDQKTSFTFQVQDDGGTANGGIDLDPNPQTFYLSISRLNHAPRGTDRTLTALKNSVYTLTAADFGFTDPDDSPPHEFQFVRIATLPTAGRLLVDSTPVYAGQPIYVPTDIKSGKLRFVPDANASGEPYASLTFQVRDDGGTVGGGVNVDPVPRTLAFNVVQPNRAPTAADGSVKMLEDGTYAFKENDLRFNDGADQPANLLKAVIITTVPATGTLRIGATSINSAMLPLTIAVGNLAQLTYTPATNHNSQNSPPKLLTFRVQDDGGTAHGGVDTSPIASTLAIDVAPVNDLPQPGVDAYSFYNCSTTFTVAAPGVLANDVDADGDRLTAELIDEFMTGSLDLRPDGSFTYTSLPGHSPVEDGFFIYRVSDGTTTSEQISVSLSIVPDTVPVSLGSDQYQTLEDVLLSVPAPGVLHNDSGSHCYSITGIGHITILGQQTNGFVTAQTDGSFTYMPLANFNGLAQFRYHMPGDINDPNVAASFASVTISVLPVNDAPSFIKGPDQNVTDETGAASIPVWANQIVPGPANENTQRLNFNVIANSNPDLFSEFPTIDADGTLAFTAKPNSYGTAEITVALRDDGGTAHNGQDTSPTQSFTIHVTKPRPRHNVLKPVDVSADGELAPEDALDVINFLNAFGSQPVPTDADADGPYFDVTGDMFIAAEDALAVINRYNTFGPEGESRPMVPIGQALPTTLPQPTNPDDLLTLLALDATHASARRKRF